MKSDLDHLYIRIGYKATNENKRAHIYLAVVFWSLFGTLVIIFFFFILRIHLYTMTEENIVVCVLFGNSNIEKAGAFNCS